MIASIYRLSKNDKVQSALKVGTLSVSGLITGAAYNSAQHCFVLVGYSDLLQPFMYLLYDFDGNNFNTCNKRKVSIDLPFYQLEAIEFVDPFVVALGNERFSNSFIKTEESLQFVNLSFLLGDYYGRKLNAVNFAGEMMRFEISHNPVNAGQRSKLVVRGANRCVPIQQEVNILSFVLVLLVLVLFAFVLFVLVFCVLVLFVLALFVLVSFVLVLFVLVLFVLVLFVYVLFVLEIGRASCRERVLRLV